jgi:hypothetical protein
MSFVYETVRINTRLDAVTDSGHIVTTNKGDILTDTGTHTKALSAGSNNQLLATDSAEETGLKWTAINDALIASGAAIDVSKLADGSVSNAEFQRIGSLASNALGESDTQSVSNKSFVDSSTTFEDNGDSAKRARLEVSGITSGQTRVLTVPDANITLVGQSNTQTLTGKTMDADSNTITNIDNADIKAGAGIDASKIANGSVSNIEFQHLAAVGSAVVAETDTQTVSNKTLVADTTTLADQADSTKNVKFDLTSVTTSTTRTVTVPDADFTVVGVDTTQTLTGKTFGDNLNMGGNKIANVGTPTDGTDVVTKQYADALAQGNHTKDPARAKTVSALPAYTQVGAGVGATLTADANGALSSVDGVSLAVNDRLLVDTNGSANDADNGVYSVTQVGDGSNPWILTRTTDADDNVSAGLYVFITEGTTCADCGFVLTTNNPITVDTTPLNFVQYSGAGQVTAGSGLTKTGNTLNAIGSDTVIANADSLEVNSSNTADQILLSSGTAGTASTFGALPLANTNSVSGQLAVANGGTGASTLTSGNFLQGNGTSAVTSSKAIPTGDVLGTSDSQVMTNKSIDADSNTITNIDNNDIKTAAGIDATKIGDGSVSSTEFQRLSAIGSAAVGVSDSQVMTNKTFTDALTHFQDNVDVSKKMQFELSAVTAGQTRTLTVPDVSITMVGTDNNQTLSNKTIDADSNTVSNIDNADIKAGAAIDASKIADGSVSDTEFQRLSGIGSAAVGVSDTQTMTNKTLTNPVIQTAINDGNGNELIGLSSTASAVNEVTISNAATGNTPSVSATGNDTNIDLNVSSKGNGNVVVNGLSYPNADGSTNQVLKTDGAGNIGFADVDILNTDTGTTSSATETTLTTLATSSNAAYIVESHIIGIRTDSGTEAGGFVLKGVFRNSAGTLVKIGDDKMHAHDSPWDANVSVNGTNIVVSVTGEALKTINWKASSKITSIAI